jgi:hypothetical protein
MKEGVMQYIKLSMCLALLVLCSPIACKAESKPSGDIRPPFVAGKFYPASDSALRNAIEKYMRDATPPQVSKPIAIIVPHAGYIYSGQICADGYNQVRGGSYDTVVILGTNHTTPGFSKIAVYNGSGFQTPLGIAQTDEELTAALLKADPDCVVDQAVHREEHSVEVHVPFVQVLFPKAKIVPVIVGTPDLPMCHRFGSALAEVLKGRRALIVASSDLSHYPSADDANTTDRQTLAAIASLDTLAVQNTIQKQMAKEIPNLVTCACGEAPILAAMAAAKSMGAKSGRIISYANSGDTVIGERSKVVGYGAVVLAADEAVTFPSTPIAANIPSASVLSIEDKKALLAFARESLSRFFESQTLPMTRGFSFTVQAPRGVFVTLKKRGQLRGCVGRLQSDVPLAKLVGTMALAAAFQDSRFPQLQPSELPEIDIEISVLTPLSPISGADKIIIGRDGVWLTKDDSAAVFLPQVAPEQGWGRDELLKNLCLKAGLSGDCWKQGAKLSTFQANVFSEEDFKPARR